MKRYTGIAALLFTLILLLAQPALADETTAETAPAATGATEQERDSSYTGFAKREGIWYYLKNDTPDRSIVGFVKNPDNGGWFFVRNGKVDWEFTGVAKSTYDQKWYFARRGKLDWGFTGVAKSVENGKWYYVRKGRLDWKYTGLAQSVKNGRLYYVRKGRLDWKKKGTVNYRGKKYTVSKGRALGSARKTILVGDSRTCLAHSYLTGTNGWPTEVRKWGKDNVYWSSRGAMGIDWVKKTGVPRIEKMIDANTNVVILTGANDAWYPERYSQYISYLNKKARQWKKKGAKTYFVSVCPVASGGFRYGGRTLKNSAIKSFNNKIRRGLSSNVTYLNAYSAMKYKTIDGIHYNKDTSIRWYRWIMNHVA